MSRYVTRDSFQPLTENVLFIVDEAHRSTGDGTKNEGMLESIRKALPNSAWVGYTGTPKFPETREILVTYYMLIRLKKLSLIKTFWDSKWSLRRRLKHQQILQKKILTTIFVAVCMIIVPSM